MLDAATSSAGTPARPLDLEFGTLFFGYPIVPYTPPPTPPTGTTASATAGTSSTLAPGTGAGARGGIGLSVMDSLRGGQTLSGRPTRSGTPVSAPDVVVSQPAPTTAGDAEGATGAHNWGTGGNALGSARSTGVKKKTEKKDGEKRKKRKEVEVIDLD